MNEPKKPESMQGPNRRWLRWLVALPFGLALAWLAAINLWLAVWGESVISRKPEKLQVSYARAWSIWPGQIVTRDLRLSVQTARNQWQLNADRAVLDVGLLALFDRSFVLHSGQADGLHFRLRRLAQPSEDLTEAARHLPEIDAYAFRHARQRQPPVPGKKPWRVTLNALELGGLREVWFDQFRVSSPTKDSLAQGSAAGALDVVMRGELALNDVKIEWSGAQLAYQDSVVARDLDLTTHLDLAPTASRKLREPETFSGLNGEVGAKATVTSLGFLRSLLPQQQRFDVSGSGELKLATILQNGQLSSGSTLEFEAPELMASVASFTGSGAGRVTGVVTQREQVQGFELKLDLENVDVGADRASPSIATAEKIQLILDGENPRLGAPMDNLRVLLELPGLAIPDLTVFAALVPRGIGLQLVGGSGVAVTRLELNDESERADFRFEASNAQLLFRGTRIEGTLLLSGKTSGQRSTGRLTLADTKVSFRGQSRPTDARRSRARPVDFEFELGDTDFLLPAKGSAISGGLRLASGVVKLNGHAADLGWWDTPLPGAEWLQLSGDATFAANLRLTGGGKSTRLAAPSAIRLDVPDFTAQLGRWTATANGHVGGDLTRHSGSNRSALEIELRAPRVVREGAPPLDVPSITVRATGPDLSRGLDISATELSVEAAKTQISDFSTFNEYLPTDHLVLKQGQGTLEGILQLRGNQADGRIRLESQRLHALVAGQRVQAQVELESTLRSSDATQVRFDPGGSTLRLTNVAFPDIPAQSGDWWAIVNLMGGDVKVGQPLQLDTDVELSLRDTEPLVHLIGQSRNLVRWFSRLLEVQNVTGIGRLILDESGLRFNELDIRGQGLSIRGRVDLRGPTAALLLIELRGLDAGIEINGDWRDVNVLRPKKWFAERSAVWDGR